VTEEDKETGLEVERKRLIGPPPCGALAIVSWSQDGVTYHRCRLHMPKRPKRDGPSKDPLSIGGSERYRYKL
jgi:hypothetical protein